MQYADGQQIKLGDRVALGSDRSGVVVCLIDSGEYTERCPEKDWSYLGRGAIVDFREFGLVHYEEVEEAVRLVERASLA